MNNWCRTAASSWERRLTAAGIGGALAERLARFLVILGEWQGATNLIGRVSVETLLRDHVLESLAGVPFLPSTGRLLDAGSGNGFPAVPLLLARPGLTGVLLEPRERRWAFLKEVLRELGVAAEVRRDRVADHLGCHDAFTARALAAEVWAPVAGRLVRPGGTVLFWAGPGPESTPTLGGFEPVLTSALPDPRRGVLAVWRRCST